MRRKDIFDALSASGIPVAHYCFPENAAPPLPWCVFYADMDGTFYADDERHYEAPQWTVELYERNADDQVESALEACIASLGTYSKVEAWLETENCLVITYMLKNMKG